MDTSTALHVYVDADILFNSLIHDSGYYFDAARWVIAAEARGIPHENIHVYSKPLSFVVLGYLKDVTCAGAGFGLTVEELSRVWDTYLRPNEDIVEAVKNSDMQNYKRQTVVFLSYSDVPLGVSGGIVNKQILATALAKTTIPTVVISSASFAPVLFQKITETRPPKNNIISIYTDSLLLWGLAERKVFYSAGTCLIYWLLDALYSAIDENDLFVKITSLHNQEKMNANATQSTSFRIEGTPALLRQPFFGPKSIPGARSQPEWKRTATLSSQNFGHRRGSGNRPCMKPALIEILESMEVPPEFFLKCYDSPPCANPGTKQIVDELAQEMTKKSLIDAIKNGAHVCDAIAYFGLQDRLREILEAYTPPYGSQSPSM